MKPQSAKSKGRNFQKEVAASLLDAIYIPFGLEPDDCMSRGMGQAGLDLMLSPSARRVLDLAIECKNQQSLNIPSTFFAHYKRYLHSRGTPLLIHKRNHTEALATLRWTDLLELLKEIVIARSTSSRRSDGGA